MAKTPTAASGNARPRFRGLVTTVLMILISIMIVRDILVRRWHVSAGGRPALVLGPLAVDPACREFGIGAALMNQALAAARARGHSAVILLGDAPYYARFGFSSAKTGELTLPGPFERERLLALEFEAGCLDGASGMIVPSGAAVPKRRSQCALHARAA